jgi:acyl-CoA reductase-like NAD-dependent aldehyde dehydrogenase
LVSFNICHCSKSCSDLVLGPIVPLLSWSSEEEVIARVNDTTSGLGGTVWSADLDKAQRLGNQIEAGTIWINSLEKPLPQGDFAGHKESGVGGEWGRHGLYSHCNAQCIHIYK